MNKHQIRILYRYNSESRSKNRYTTRPEVWIIDKSIKYLINDINNDDLSYKLDIIYE